MRSAVALAVLGHHPCEVTGLTGEVPDHGWFDAVDLLVRDGSGEVAVLGFRTADYVTETSEHGDPTWRRGAPSAPTSGPAAEPYLPLPIAFDPASIRHWDFGQVLWVGPATHPCLVWSNAEALSVRGLWTVLGPDPRPVRTGRVLAGPDGAGLPGPAALGIEVPADVVWIGSPS